MTFGAPFFIWAAAAAAGVTVALHLLAWRRPPESALPTARFAPEAPIRTVSRAVRPADVLLLALRVLLVMLVGVALAQPSFTPHVDEPGRVVVVDRSRFAQGDSVAAVARRQLRSGDALILFDSAAREISRPTADSIGSARPASGDGAISAALVAATRAAYRLERGRDSVEIVIVSPFARNELDAATAPVRRMWHGALRTIRAGAPPNDSVPRGHRSVRAASGDPVAATLSLAGDTRGGSMVRVIRDAPTADDTAWARAGNALVAWPASDTGLVGGSRRPVSDTAYGVTAAAPAGADDEARSATVVARFERRAKPPAGRVIARWDDGEPAATEVSLGGGCVRSVAIAVPVVGDLALTPAFQRLAARIASACSGAESWSPASDSLLDEQLAANGARGADGQTLLATTGTASRLTVWLLAAAMLAALAELIVRRGADATA